MAALRKIRLEGDPILREVSKPVRKITPRTLELLDDMVETMYEEMGVGLAAPQVGVLRRIVVIDVGEGIYKMINPEILKEDGSQVGVEGCLSVLGKAGTVDRPDYVKVRYIDESGKEKTIEADDFFARAICHEIDHLNGILYVDKVIEYVEVETEE